MQDPELHQMFVQHATDNAAAIVSGMLGNSESQPKRTSKTLTFSAIRQYMMEVLRERKEVVAGDFRKHPKLKDLKASVFSQNLAMLQKDGKVKKTKRSIGRSTIWVKS